MRYAIHQIAGSPKVRVTTTQEITVLIVKVAKAEKKIRNEAWSNPKLFKMDNQQLRLEIVKFNDYTVNSHRDEDIVCALLKNKESNDKLEI